MRQIYLASKSRARRDLLKSFGIKFKVMPSRAPEKQSAGTMSPPELARHNARLKAQDAARRVRGGGIVIAADTLVVQDGRVSGKPKDMRDARLMLKRLSSKPHYLYTGIAVIDTAGGKRLEAVEKTKVYMDPLSDIQISRYFAKVSVLDKAGGFDIQGRGAFFIRRIEGCFYNVVGLPLRSLSRMLSKFGVNVFALLVFSAASLVLSGCATEYNVVTGRQESYYYSSDKEEQMGEAISRQVEKEYKLVDDPLIARRVEEIGERIAAVSDRTEIKYTFRVLDEDEVNAVSLPGGFVYVNRGLIEKVSSDDELAAVLAHEVGHIVARHSIKKLQAMQQYTALRILLSQAPQAGAVGATADAAFTELLLGYAREDELLADQLGARYAGRAGYDPHGMITFLEKLQEINRRKPLRPRSYFRTHPFAPDRIRVTKQELGEGMDFTDYINIEDKPSGS